METTTSLIQNLAVLLALVLAHGLLLQFAVRKNLHMQIVAGVLYGAIAIVGMLLPFTLMPGVFFDGRTVVLSLAGLFGGPISGVIAAVMASLYRLASGGGGMFMGVATIWTATLLGLLGYRLRATGRLHLSWSTLLALGLIVHVTALAWTLTLPAPIRESVLQSIALPFVTVLPAAMALLGQLLLVLENRRRTEQALADVETQLQIAVDAANVGIWIWDRRDDSVYFSAQWKRQLGYAEHELENRFDEWVSRLHPADKDATLSRVSEYAEHPHGSYQGEFRLRHRDGSYRWFMTQASMETDANDKPIRMLGSHIDITASHEREQEIRALNTELDQRVRQRTAELETLNQELQSFSYTVSHDLKAPLRAITGYSQLLTSEYAAQLTGDAQHYLNRITAGAQAMNQQIEALLRYSRMERQQLGNEPIDPDAVVRQVLAERAEQLGGVELRLSLAAKTARIDAEGLALVVRNLLENAIKFSARSPQPWIEMSTVHHDDTCRLCVADNGIGFDMSHSDQIFEIFNRLERSAEYPGTGIGLAMVRKATQRMGGRVWAESAPGEGARFYVEMPV